MPSMRKIFISLQRPEVLGSPTEGGTLFLFPKVLGHPSSFSGNLFCRTEPSTTKGYMMLNLLVKNKDVWSKVEWYTRVGRTSIV